MNRYNQEVLIKLKATRKQGHSIPELMKMFNMPKTSVWHHVKDIILDDKAKNRISQQQGGSKVRSQNEWIRAKQEAYNLLNNKKYRELCIKASMLYWAEGNKESLVFTNTNPDIIKIFLLFLQEPLQISDKRIRLLIRTSDPLNPELSINFWRQQVNINKKYISSHHKEQNKTKSKHGICRLWITKGGYSFKVLQCMIDTLKKLS